MAHRAFPVEDARRKVVRRRGVLPRTLAFEGPRGPGPVAWPNDRPIQFHTDLYRRDAVESAAVKYRGRARIDIAESGPHLVARIEPLARDEDRQSLVDEFCNDVFSATATQMRNASAEAPEPDDAAESPWALLAPFGEGTRLPLGWSIESLSAVRAGAATLVLAHAEFGSARIAIRRNGVRRWVSRTPMGSISCF